MPPKGVTNTEQRGKGDGCNRPPVGVRGGGIIPSRRSCPPSGNGDRKHRQRDLRRRRLPASLRRLRSPLSASPDASLTLAVGTDAITAPNESQMNATRKGKVSRHRVFLSLAPYVLTTPVHKFSMKCPFSWTSYPAGPPQVSPSSLPHLFRWGLAQVEDDE
ncbi:hypothetical protein GW17_00015331 [Ensete ventricosum]|nr:hypothetical protein GW17_00015331 [Ensete ventricosum]RZS00242.1 hypothetical protein BHM03_00029890 [Ensete ventricosum]